VLRGRKRRPRRGAVDPRQDVEIIETELLADLDTVSKRIAKQAKAAEAGNKR
jgi:ribosome-binding ATPase YchF (GTP1/OBG family)